MATQKADVIVVGAGIFGLSVALACLRRGLEVVVLEKGQVGCGASGGVVGALSPHVPDQWNPKKAYQLQALLAGERYWAEIAALSSCQTSYARTGRILPLPTPEARALAEERARSAEELWQGKAEWCLAEDAKGWLARGAAPFGMVHETLSARIFPQTAMSALAEAFRRAGGRIEEYWPVEALDGDHVAGAKGRWFAGAVVIAAGVAGFALLEPYLGVVAGTGVKGQAAVLAAECDGAEPILFHDGIYIVPHGPGRVSVGSTSEREWSAPDQTDDQLDAVIARARAMCPKLDGAEVVSRWAGVRPKARRRDPMLGPVPDQPGLFAALGGFKIGFGLAPMVGETLADMISDTPTELPDSFTVAHHL